MFNKESEDEEGDQNLPMFQKESEDEGGDQNINVSPNRETMFEVQAAVSDDDDEGEVLLPGKKTQQVQGET